MIGRSLIFLAALLLSGCAKYPTKSEVDVFISSLQKSASAGQSGQDLKQFLKRLSSPKSVQDDAVLAHAVKSLASEYLRAHDNAILEAVDSTRIDAGFANFICGFYHDIKQDDGFLTRYRDTRFRPGVQRCAGSWFADDKELDALLQKSTASSPHGR